MTRFITDKIAFVPGRRGGHYPHCNSLFIDDGERAVIDPGSDKKLLRPLAERGVGTVILSHFHSDHLRDLREFPESRVLVHSSEREAVESWEGMRKIAFFPDEVPDPSFVRRKEREVGGWGWKVAGGFEDGEEIMVGKTRVVVLHCPGHTMGHCCFWMPDQKVLYASDVDLTDFGPWYGNACSGVRDFLASIKRLEQLNPEITVTAHEVGVVTGDIRDRLRAYGRIILERQEKILRFLDRPRSRDEITAQAFIYGPHLAPGGSFHLPEQRMVRHHLAFGLEEGLIAHNHAGFVRTDS